MEYPWERRLKNRKEARYTLRSSGLSFHILWFVGLAFVILGIIAGAMKATIGLGSTDWFLLAVAIFVAALPMSVSAAVAAQMLGMEGESKKD